MVQFTDEMRRLCKDREVSATGFEITQSVISSDPARTPRTSSLSPNIPVEFASTKNGVMIATESMLEYANALDHEISRQSLLALNQPKFDCPIKYKSNGRYTVANPTFDFFVISETFIGFEEVKLSKNLYQLSRKAPDRFLWDERATEWRSPVIEEKFKGTGLGFRYVTERKFTQFLLDNYNFLLGYLSSKPHENYQEDVKTILAVLEKEKCVDIKALSQKIYTIASIYRLICHGGVYFPIRNRSLLNDKVSTRKIYLDEAIYYTTQKALHIDLDGGYEHLPFSKQIDFLRKSDALADIDGGLSVKDVASSHKVSKSTLYNWIKKRNESGMTALIHNKDKRGNYRKRYGEEIYSMATAELGIELKKSEAVSMADAVALVHDSIFNKCGVEISERTLYKYGCSLQPEMDNDRFGAKVASKSSRFSSNKTSDDLGIYDVGFFLARCHIDHTQVDLEVVNEDGTPLGRPWLTTIVDEHTNKILSNYLSFRKPSYVTAMMAIRLMVYNHGLFAAAFVTDGGKEFSSKSFKYLAACYKSSVLDRTGKPWVSTIERLFGTLNTMVFHNLKGNTKIMKDIRSVSATHNPKRLAYYTMAEAYELIDGASVSINNNIPIRAQKTPNQLQKISIEKHGIPDIRKVKYNQKFITESLPFIKGRKTVSLIRNQYVNFDNKKYWHTTLRLVPKKGTSVLCKYDPWDQNHIYPLYNDNWLEFSCSKRLSTPQDPNELKIFGELSSRELTLNLSAKTVGKRKVRRDVRIVKDSIEEERFKQGESVSTEMSQESFPESQKSKATLLKPSFLFESEIIEDDPS